MKNLFVNISAAAALLLLMVAPLPAALTECSASGFNCNLLITLNKNGSLSLTSDPTRPGYPAGDGTYWDIGSLVGFKNSSNAAVYSLRLNAIPGDSPEAQGICSPASFGTPNYTAPNVKFVNSPNTANGNLLGVYYYYNACPNCNFPWATSCDVTFTGGVPKNGVTYFSIHNVAPNTFQHFQVHTNTVVPWITFQDTLLVGQTANATLTLFPPNASTVTLNLATLSGGASAVFAANSSTTLALTVAGSIQIPIRGVTVAGGGSSTPNMQLSATVSGTQRSLNFAVQAPPTISATPSSPDIWYFGFIAPAGYPTSINLTSSAGASTTWTVTAGANMVNLSANVGASITVTSSGTAFSTGIGDIQIKATANNLDSAPYVLTSRTPTYTVPFAMTPPPNNTPGNVDITCTGIQTGYRMTIFYFVEDNLMGLMPTTPIGINEAFPDSNWLMPDVDYPGSDWIITNNIPNGISSTNSAFADSIDGQAPGHNPATNGCAPTNTPVVHIRQEWWVGSTNTGIGKRVQTNVLQKYQERAFHTTIVTPAP